MWNVTLIKYLQTDFCDPLLTSHKMESCDIGIGGRGRKVIGWEGREMDSIK